MEQKTLVGVRMRPRLEECASEEFEWKLEDDSISLLHHNSPIDGVKFYFDHVFDDNCNNDAVYNILVRNIVQSVVEGFDGTILAYGQTGSGKTFTMKGIIHRAVEDLFNNIQQRMAAFKIRVSCIQINNEEIVDLLHEDNNNKLETADSFLRGPYVAGLSQEIVKSVNEVVNLFQKASSCSVDPAHKIFVMVIHNSTSNATARVSVLNLVDLAGSERADKNLMVLSHLVKKLSENVQQRVQLASRDSKLTHLLRGALGGCSKTSIICTIAPEQVHIEETKVTLQFATDAKKIINRVKVKKIGRLEQHLDEFFDKLEELEENENQMEEDEGSDEEGHEEHDGEDEELESHGEDYGNVGTDSTEDDAEDYHPGEIYYERYHESINWQHHLNNILLAPLDGLYLKAGAIWVEAGRQLTSSPAFPAVNWKEIANFFEVFESGVRSHDLQLGGKEYTMIRVEADTMHGQKGDECVTVMKSQLTLIFGVYEKPMIRAQCDALVRALANTITSMGC